MALTNGFQSLCAPLYPSLQNLFFLASRAYLVPFTIDFFRRAKQVKVLTVLIRNICVTLMDCSTKIDCLHLMSIIPNLKLARFLCEASHCLGYAIRTRIGFGLISTHHLIPLLQVLTFMVQQKSLLHQLLQHQIRARRIPTIFLY